MKVSFQKKKKKKPMATAVSLKFNSVSTWVGWGGVSDIILLSACGHAISQDKRFKFQLVNIFFSAELSVLEANAVGCSVPSGTLMLSSDASQARINTQLAS